MGRAGASLVSTQLDPKGMPPKGTRISARSPGARVMRESPEGAGRSPQWEASWGELEGGGEGEREKKRASAPFTRRRRELAASHLHVGG